MKNKMADQDFRNDHSEELNRHEHRRKNVSGKAVVLYGYDPASDNYYPINVTANPDGSYSLKNDGTPGMAIEIDDTAPPITYIGKASPGTANSASTWQIKKIDSTSGTAITWASGNTNFDKVWDNRASLSYS